MSLQPEALFSVVTISRRGEKQSLELSAMKVNGGLSKLEYLLSIQFCPVDKIAHRIVAHFLDSESLEK